MTPPPFKLASVILGVWLGSGERSCVQLVEHRLGTVQDQGQLVPTLGSLLHCLWDFLCLFRVSRILPGGLLPKDAGPEKEVCNLSDR